MKRGQMWHGALGFILALALSFLTIFWSEDALAIPTFQTYIEGATAGSSGDDQNTWFSTSNPFNLAAVGAYTGDNTAWEFIGNATLLISVPQGETGTISVGGLSPLTSAPGTGLGADISILNNVTGSNGYSTLSFLPDNLTLHYPLQDNVSDFLIYGVGIIGLNSGLNDYNASTGTIILDPEAIGEQKVFNVGFSGFSQLHFDLYARAVTMEVFESWVINPDSHDATAGASAAAVPEPSTLLLLGSGLAGLGLFGRRRFRSLEA